MKRFETALRGRLVYEITGVQPEALLNACAAEGVPFSDVLSVDAWTLRLSVPEHEGTRLERLARLSRCEAELLQRRGGSRDRALLRRRLPLLLFALAVLLGLFVSSLYVWEVEVNGAETLGRGRVLRALEDSGVYPGVFWPNVDVDAVRSKMLTRVPELAWMTVRVHGSRAEAVLLERSEKPEICREDEAADVIAERTGIVTKVSVLSGRPLVRPGQAVLRGETLVSGTLESIANGARQVRARAEILADTQLELMAVSPAQTAKTAAGRGARVRFALCIGKRRVNFYRKGGKALDGYDKIIREYVCGIPGLFTLPLRLVKEELRPYQTAGPAQTDAEELRERLTQKLETLVRGELLSVTCAASGEDGQLCVTLHAAAREDIAQTLEAAK